MQQCFIDQNITKLKQVLSKMDPNEAAYHMQRCIDSGLWVENANQQEKEE
jgi:cell division cycle protein 37